MTTKTVLGTAERVLCLWRDSLVRQCDVSDMQRKHFIEQTLISNSKKGGDVVHPLQCQRLAGTVPIGAAATPSRHVLTRSGAFQLKLRCPPPPSSPYCKRQCGLSETAVSWVVKGDTKTIERVRRDLYNVFPKCFNPDEHWKKRGTQIISISSDPLDHLRFAPKQGTYATGISRELL